ncbi:beta-eliminating lyase-related protein [Acetobacteraceae bacterium KSS8]|uniref:L-threonine aldolase n=1 Tax=Endosaccharibacter trunci TaxID=2812733 RepID=A0ABT1W574_9PROT|nr:beta-eliminating lyase-related protein [Acetobacteraceae bacterium KSS8]
MTTPIRKNFSSDNVGPVCPAIMRAMIEANTGDVPSYGSDPWTEKLTAIVRERFEAPEAEVFAVSTGTAANALALSALVPPYGGVYCDGVAHIQTDECGAPEFFTAGAKLLTLPSRDGKLSADALRRKLDASRALGVNHVLPTAVSVTQATEWGTLYAPDELRAITGLARELGLHVHMDGARFANALATLGCAAAELTTRAGIDVLSLGATKNGAMAAEAVIFFKPALAQEFARRRKRAAHTWSKARFLSAQLIAYLTDDLWLENARTANRAAARLAEGLGAIPGVELLFPVQINELFVVMPDALIARLREAGYLFYDWYLPDGVAARDGTSPVRLVTSLDATEADVEGLLSVIPG